jgi:hypothetical protein
MDECYLRYWNQLFRQEVCHHVRAALALLSGGAEYQDGVGATLIEGLSNQGHKAVPVAVITGRQVAQMLQLIIPRPRLSSALSSRATILRQTT